MRLVTRIARQETIHELDGRKTFLEAIKEGLQPDPSLPLDEWADNYMIIPRSTGAAEYGKYRVSRTPHARLIMQCLSVRHPARRVILQAASQMLKTQIFLNWMCYIIHQHPGNILSLMPTGKLHKRIVQRIDRVIEAVEVVRRRVSPPGSRLATNSQDIKVFQGGTLYIASSGSAANLSEVPARFVAADEIDRAELSIDGEGDPIRLAEARQTTFFNTAKSYYYSSPTIKGESRIAELYENGTQREALAECIHCGEAQPLVFEHLTDDGKYPCSYCGGLHEESDKGRMFAKGLWSDPVKESKDESFKISAMFQPYGWLSWKALKEEYTRAKEHLDEGREEQMIVFYNTRLASVWERKKEQTQPEVLQARAEDYRLGEVPQEVIFITSAVDTQDDRFEYMAVGWGKGLEAWVLDYRVIFGSPDEKKTLKTLDETLDIRYNENKPIDATFIDSGGHYTQEVYNFCRGKEVRRIFPTKGSATPNKPIIAGRSRMDIHYSGKIMKKGVTLWLLGTDTAKDYIYSRLKKTAGYGQIHFSNELSGEFYKGLTSEYRATRMHRGRRVTYWALDSHERNEPLDLMVGNVAAAYYLGLHKLTVDQWDRYSKKRPMKKRIANKTAFKTKIDI